MKRMLMEPCLVVENHQQSVMTRMSMEPHLLMENHPQMLFFLLSLRACHWQFQCSRSRKTCSYDGRP